MIALIFSDNDNEKYDDTQEGFLLHGRTGVYNEVTDSEIVILVRGNASCSKTY